ncbi:hypothetical protein GOV10_06645 [Candidatus Woesearchaeota archaeon]|nr:hypothetical protein [Candidatus Woesearchaeota archaeon]
MKQKKRKYGPVRGVSLEEFGQLIDIIRKHKHIDQEELKYKQTTIQGLSEEKFGTICDIIYNCLEPIRTEDANCDFPEYHIDYKGIRFHLMLGQGSTYWTTTQK